jgi:hypothetical protein
MVTERSSRQQDQNAEKAGVRVQGYGPFRIEIIPSPCPKVLIIRMNHKKRVLMPKKNAREASTLVYRTAFYPLAYVGSFPVAFRRFQKSRLLENNAWKFPETSGRGISRHVQMNGQRSGGLYMPITM